VGKFVFPFRITRSRGKAGTVTLAGRFSADQVHQARFQRRVRLEEVGHRRIALSGSAMNMLLNAGFTSIGMRCDAA
jgi:hypothetical protein